jgi:hypothetical protein
LEEIMYARVTSYQVDPTKIEDMRAKLPSIMPQLEKMAGLIDWYSVWRADGRGYVLTVFKDKASADASLELARDIWGGLSKLLIGQPKPETFDNVETLIK